MGPYEILTALGAGGMGEVYRARDTRLRREVAIKILRSGFHTSKTGRERLLQEARAVSALNHPNIVTLHDICSENGAEFLVMELVRGKTLDQLIGTRGLRLNETLRYAIPIADALALAHAAGILHLDLKPSNIMITDDGVPKVLDFGIARLAQPKTIAEQDATLTQQPPQFNRHTVAGTAAYMSPEQAEGKELDARSDIFSFGAVLYEMVTGRRAFAGDSTVSTLSAVLQNDPEPPTRSAPQLPTQLERIIQRCLRKDRNRRFHSMSDVKVELEEVREESEPGMQPVEAPAPSGQKTWSGRKTWAARKTWMYAAAAFALVVAATALFWWRRESAPPPPTQPVPLTTYPGAQGSPDFSPDGSQLVFVWWKGQYLDESQIYAKPVSSTTPLQLTRGKPRDSYPKWSPDAQWIAFQRNDNGNEYTFLTTPIGGSERKLRDGRCVGLSWSIDSKALACGADSGLILISTDTGETKQLTAPPKGQSDSFPAFSSDGNKLLFARGAGTADSDLYMLELNNDLAPRGSARRITSEHAVITGGLTWTSDNREAIWAMSTTTRFASTLYRVPILSKGSIQPVPFVGRPVDNPAIARQGNRLAYSRWSLDVDIWRANGHTSERDPVSSTEVDNNPQFSPDGGRIAFESARSGPLEIWVANSDGTNPVQLTHFGHQSATPRWSPDGRWIVFSAYTGSGDQDIWVIDSSGGKPRQITTGPGGSLLPSFSHDGKWIYFASNRTGHSQIFRVPFGGGAQEQLTHKGGSCALESVDAKTVYYLHVVRPSVQLYEVPVRGGEERSLGVDVLGRAFQVMPDGIYFITRTDNNAAGRELRFYDFRERRSRLIQSLGEIRALYGLAVSPDRKSFLYALEQDQGAQLMLVDNFR